MTKYFITGIGTGVGKTVVSAALTQYFRADYWKPIQCGDEEGTDKEFLLRAGISETQIYPETHFLKAPQSPHLASQLENIEIDLNDFELPDFKSETVIIEGAGGILVPLNQKSDYVIDLAQKFQAQVILVVRHYLGSINHTLLSIDYLKRNGFDVKGIIISGTAHQPSEDIILNQGIALIGRVPEISGDYQEGIQKIEWYGE